MLTTRAMLPRACGSLKTARLLYSIRSYKKQYGKIIGSSERVCDHPL